MPEAEEKPFIGRPSKYSKTVPNLAQVEEMAAKGFTVYDFAEVLGIAPSTFSKWLTEHPDFSEAVKKGRDRVDKDVVDSLFKQAIGYTKKVQKATKFGPVEIDEYFPPVPVAAFFWLCNRQPESWKHKQTVVNEGGEIRPLAVQVVTNQADANKIEAAFEVLEGGALPAPAPAPAAGPEKAVDK